jgi:TetR/AcrR family transcriptional repressor of nem operon
VLASFLINAWEGAVLGAKVEKNGTPFEEFEEIVFEKLLTSSPQPAEE